MSVNRVVLVGNLEAEPEVRATRSGTSVCNLRVATTEQFMDRDGNRTSRTHAEQVRFLGRGSGRVSDRMLSW